MICVIAWLNKASPLDGHPKLPDSEC